MSEIAPPSRGAPPPSPTPPPHANVPAPPPELRALAVGAKLEALVLAVRSDGAVQVRTDLATFDIRPETAPTLKPGALVQVLLAAKAPQLRLSLLAIDGRPLSSGTAGAAVPTASPRPTPGGAATGGSAAPTTPMAGIGRTAPAAPVNLTVGSQVTATLLRPAAAVPAAPNASSAAATGGTGTTATAASAGTAGTAPQITPGAATPPSTGSATAAGKPAVPTSALPAAGGGTAAGVPSPPTAVAGSTLGVRLTAVVPPQPGQAGAATAPPSGPPVVPQVGQPLQGTVVAQPASHTGGHATVVETRAGTFALPTAQPLPPGTQVTLEPLNPLAPPPASTATHPSAHLADPALLFGREWPALEESAAALAEISPGAQQAILQMLARPDTQLGANLLFFLAALRGGDVRGWLGDGPTRVLERLRPELAGRLGEEFSRLARLADEPGSNDWRVVAVPFADGDDVHRIRFLTRQPPQGEDESDGGHGTRFLVDVELTRLGRLQLDGLVAKDGKRVNLLVRSDQPLPGRMRDDIRVIFQEAAALTGLQGGVGFQAQPAGFVDLAAAVPASGRTGIEV